MTQTPSAKPQKKRDPRLTMLLDGLKRIFIHNWPTKLLALLLAIILWGGLITQDPTLTREKHFSSVSVSVSGEESVKRNGFIVTSDLTSLLGDVSLTAEVCRCSTPTPRRRTTTSALTSPAFRRRGSRKSAFCPPIPALTARFLRFSRLP